jgi:glycosyltransferase 2 family protein
LFRRLRFRRIWFQIALSGIFLGILIWRVNLIHVFQTFSHVNYIWVLPALLCFTASKFIHAYRWQLLLAETEEAPLPDLFAIYLISNMANNAVPFRIGDAIRVQVPAQRFGIPRAELAAAVFVAETVLDGFTFLILMVIVLSFLRIAILPAGLAWGLAVAITLAFVASLLAARLRPPTNLAEKPWMRIFAVRTRQTIARAVPEFIEGLAAMREPKRTARVIAISFPAWLAEAVMYWLFGLAFNLDLAFDKFIVVMIAANLVVALPITPWNLGTYEVALQSVLAAFGVNGALAGAYAIGTHIFSIFWITTTGLIAMWLLRLDIRDVLSLRARPGAREEHEARHKVQWR